MSAKWYQASVKVRWLRALVLPVVLVSREHPGLATSTVSDKSSVSGKASSESCAEFKSGSIIRARNTQRGQSWETRNLSAKSTWTLLPELRSTA